MSVPTSSRHSLSPDDLAAVVAPPAFGVATGLLAMSDIYQFLVEQGPAVTIVQGLRDEAFYISPQIEGMLGYKAADFVAEPTLWESTIHEGDRARVLEHRWHSAETQSPFCCEYRQTARDGHQVWVRDKFSLIREADGSPQYWLGHKIDITAEKEAESVIHRSEEARGLALAAAKMASWDWDAPTSRLVWSDTLYGFLGLPLDGPPLEHDAYLAMVHPDDRERVAAHDKAAARGEIPFQIEYRVLPQGGGVRWLYDVGRVVWDEGGQPFRILGVSQDVTARKLAEEQLQAAKEAAEEGSRLKSMFLSTVSHELRTPMTSIRGYIELLIDGEVGELSVEQTEFLTIVDNNIRRLSGLIDDVLDLSKIEAGRMEMLIEPVDLAAIAARVVTELTPQAAAKGLTLLFAAPTSVPAVAADNYRTHQILVNLIGNAVKFTEAGEVHVSVRAVAAAVELAVADTGIGIAPLILPTVFDEFRQADGDTTRRYGGTGLGLAIARRLAELQSGSLRAESTLDRGSTFTLSLPAFTEVGSPAGPAIASL